MTQDSMNTNNVPINGSPIITQTTTNKIQTSRKIQVPNANNTTTEIEETVVKYENVTVSTTQSVKPQQQYEKDNGNTRSPTESEIIEGYTVPYSSTQEEPQNILTPYQPQTTTYNPPGTYGPFPASYSQPPSSPTNGYIAAQREQPPTSIQSNLPPEYFNQQQSLPNLYYNDNISPEFYKQQQPLPNLYNNLPTQIPMTIPMDLPPQQLYLNYPTDTTSSTINRQQQPYFPPGYVPADEIDKKGKGKVKISKKFRIGN
ncbi:hypothetical protein C1645_751465 [Glomus cerebriforme]|uniref:Uncharacterized protein n=1 Tax=Glomus cerebriforme TaxID=658196 RepID=A0A397TLG4_9GLOM|nr:hypothetical protein C1645_751465 [Glomus cerebriforme]